MKLSEYILNGERGASLALAKKIGAHASDMSTWVNGIRSVPPLRCIDIERATNSQVTRKDLRPNDWQQHWPELVDKAA